MHHIYAKLNDSIYHLFSDPDFHRVTEMVKMYAGLYKRASFVCIDHVPSNWTATGRKSAYDFARTYWGSGVVLDLHANPGPGSRRRPTHDRP